MMPLHTMRHLIVHRMVPGVPVDVDYRRIPVPEQADASDQNPGDCHFGRQ
jgi:hypothetical protein